MPEEKKQNEYFIYHNKLVKNVFDLTNGSSPICFKECPEKACDICFKYKITIEPITE